MNRDYILQLITKITGDKTKAELIIERLTEEGVLHLGYGDKEVDRILAAFSNAFGTTKASKHDRFAASRLAKKYGAQAIVGIITLLADNSTTKYAPVTNSVVQLEEKLPSILHFLRNQTGNEVIDI